MNINIIKLNIMMNFLKRVENITLNKWALIFSFIAIDLYNSYKETGKMSVSIDFGSLIYGMVFSLIIISYAKKSK